MAPYACVGENMVNTAVVKVSGMSLLEIDEAWVGPSLNVLDNKVDAGISKILTVLYSGRQYDVAVEMATKTKNFVTEKVSTAFRSATQRLPAWLTTPETRLLRDLLGAELCSPDRPQDCGLNGGTRQARSCQAPPQASRTKIYICRGSTLSTDPSSW